MKNIRGIIFICTAVVSILLIVFPNAAWAHVKYGERTAQIIITDQGFNPPTTTIDQGTILIFSNESAKPSWPSLSAALFHHVQATAPIPPHALWSVRPMHKGKWTITDKQSPKHTGFVAVKENANISYYMVDANTKIPTGTNWLDRFGDLLKNLPHKLKTLIHIG